MTRWRVAITAATLLAATPAQAAEVALRSKVGLLVGQFSHMFDFSVYEPSVNAAITAGSRLHYPLNMMLVAAEVSVGGGTSRDRPWELVLSASTNVTDPWGSMEDSDYLVNSKGSEVEFSYTESSTELRALLADLGARIRLTAWGGGSRALALELCVGYRHQFLYADVYGARGWALDASASRKAVSLPDGTHAIHFDTHQAMPYLGLRLRGHWGGRFSLAAETRALAVVSVSFDEHVLRNKDAHGLAGGVGVLLAAHPRWRLSDPAAGVVLSLGVAAELLATYAGAGTLEQSYHGDDPSLSGDQSGVALPDVDYVTSNVQLSLLGTLQLSF